jgi:hypothetical protein
METLKFTKFTPWSPKFLFSKQCVKHWKIKFGLHRAQEYEHNTGLDLLLMSSLQFLNSTVLLKGMKNIPSISAAPYISVILIFQIMGHWNFLMGEEQSLVLLAGRLLHFFLSWIILQTDNSHISPNSGVPCQASFLTLNMMKRLCITYNC